MDEAELRAASTGTGLDAASTAYADASAAALGLARVGARPDYPNSDNSSSPPMHMLGSEGVAPTLPEGLGWGLITLTLTLTLNPNPNPNQGVAPTLPEGAGFFAGLSFATNGGDDAVIGPATPPRGAVLAAMGGVDSTSIEPYP